MSVRVNPLLIDELERYGAQDVAKCYHCGNCSAVCPFSREPFLFPRRLMRSLQLGLESRLRSALEPWLCYYCGECSQQCPRGAEPGETMMSLRRWLTAQYDVTGISRLFYRSWRAELVAVLLLAVITGLAFGGYGLAYGNLAVYDGPGAFLPGHVIHRFDLVLAAGLALLLLVNCARMWWFTVARWSGPPVPRTAYLKRALLLPLHFFTQKRYGQCGHRGPWAIHLVLMLSYVALFTLIVFFVEQMQSGPAIDWRVHGVAYAATAGLLGGTVLFIRARRRASEPQFRRSHESDWIFLVLLLAVTVTGMLQHGLHRAGYEVAANIGYVAHLMVAVPMLVLEVPFSKWAHMAYRPLAMYFAALQVDAVAAAAVRQAPAGAQPAATAERRGDPPGSGPALPRVEA